MVIIKMVQKQIDMPDVSIVRLIDTLRDFKLAYMKGAGYMPLFERNDLTDRLQEINGFCSDTQIIKIKTLNTLYRQLLK